MILFNAKNAPHNPISTETPPAKIDTATADTIYKCWEESISVTQYIEQVLEVAGVITIGYALGAWTGRAGFTYVPLNDYTYE